MMATIVFFLPLFVYLLFAGRFDFIYLTTKTNYFILLADAFLHGQFHLRLIPITPLNDLSFFNNHAYLYWPPLPSILMLPLVSLFGTKISDILILAITAAFPPLLLFLILKELRKIKLIKIKENFIALLSLFFAFGTCYFSISVQGTVWFTSQIVALLVFLLALLFIIRFSRTNKLIDFLIASFTFAAIAFARMTLLATFPLFVYFIFKRKRAFIFPFLIIFITSLILLGVYNFKRFNSFWETGLKFHNMNLRYRDNFLKFGPLSLTYLPHNFFYTIINPLMVTSQFPFVNPDPEGNSLLITSPLFLLLFLSLVKKVKLTKQRKTFSGIVFLTLVLTVLPILCYLGSGWFQFGNRYLLDCVPLAIILLAIILPLIPKRLFYILFFTSIIINTLGALWLLSLAPYLYF